MSTYQQLEQKIQELQAEVDRLKAQEKKDKLPENFDRQDVFDFLNDPEHYSLESAFDWDNTPQGCAYWNDIECDSGEKENYKVPDEAIIQLQKWVILSYQQQYGN
jgi:hypothetical protein